uniref:Oxidoreductase n=1 Tax=Fusarium oxysporum (strain Fo5176) TaxID=660025 RepID=A0A0D2XJG0_FUSOF
MAPFKGFNPETNIPSLTGKVILITGGTSGLGRSAILTLASHNPSHIYFTGRSSTSASSLISTISPVPATFLECDLTSIASMRSVAKQFTHDRLDVFIANAGVMAVDGLTQDGLELQFGVNHVGNATLLMALLPIMQKTAEKGGEVRFGGYNTAWAAAGDVKRDETVAFYEPVGKANKGDDMCFSEELGKKLWEWTEEKIESVKQSQSG